MAKTKDSIKEESIGTYEYVKNAYTVYGRDISLDGYQLGRNFCGYKDGLKISFRHLLQTLIESPDRLIKVQAITSDCMKKYHFHGDAAMTEVLYSLKKNYHLVEVLGNSGSRTMTSVFEGAAGRYPEAKLKTTVREQLTKLMPFVPEEITSSNFKEKAYIPTPIPLGLVAGGQGMGVGMDNLLPAFTAESIYKAYQKNDPTLLRLSYGYCLGDHYNEKSSFNNKTNVITGKDISDNKPNEKNAEQLASLWTTGRGKLQIYIPVYNCNINGQDGYMLVCDPNIFRPTKTKELIELEASGLIEIFDYSDTIGKMFVSLTPRTKKITNEDLLKIILNSKGFTWSEISYRINISTEKVVGPIGIYNWVKYTDKNFRKLYAQYIQSELNKLDFEEICWYNLRAIADCLYEKKKKYTDTEIVKIVNDKLEKGTKKDKLYKITEEHAAWVGEKAMNTLRNVDPIEKLKKLEESKTKFKTLDIDAEIKAFISCLKDD